MPLIAGEASNHQSLKVKNITKVFVGLRALDNVSLELKRGEILGLIGPNGSGKTTLINVITGLLPLTSGEIYADEFDLTGQPAHKIARAGIARTYQTIRLFKELTVRENVEVAAVSVGIKRNEVHDYTEAIMGELNLSGWSEHLSKELPYGFERRVEIARALAMSPKYLLLDEPAAGLNEEESDELLEMLVTIPAKKGLGMLIVDHDMRLIMRLCNRLHVLNYGKTIGEGTPEDVRRIPAVIEAYLGSTATGE